MASGVAGGGNGGGVQLRTVPLDRELWFPESRLRDEEVVEHADGGRTWLLQPPSRRRWGADELLEEVRAVRWSVEERDGGVWLRSEARSEVDLLVLSPAASRGLDDEAEALSVYPLASSLGPARDLREFLVGGAVLAPPFPWGHRLATEQVALSLYRIARLRGGLFWDGLAGAISGWVARRMSRPGGPASAGDHLRMVADAGLLLLAEAARTGQAEVSDAAGRALDTVRGCAVELDQGGCWYRHDRGEAVAGRNDEVLPTHLQAIVLLRAAGEDCRAGEIALRGILGRRAPARVRPWSALLTVSELARAGRGPVRRVGSRAAHAALGRIGGLQAATPFHRLPGGRLLRDTLDAAELSHYFMVALLDLASVAANFSDAVLTSALEAALAAARRSRYLAAEIRAGGAICGHYPSALRMAGHVDQADRAAERLRLAGYPAAVGWPGYEDHLWDRLAPGTP